jgi:hypothetical protein
VRGDFLHGSRELVVQVAVESVELLGHVERDDGYFALVLDEDAWFSHGDDLYGLYRCELFWRD